MRLASPALGALLALACWAPALPSAAGDAGLQPLVGGVLLDPEYDAAALQRTMGLSLGIQAGRQGGVVLTSLATAELLEAEVAPVEGELGAAARRSARSHRTTAVLAGAGFSTRLVGALVTFGARGSLAGAVAGFTVPFLVGGAIDGASAALSYIAAVQVIREVRQRPELPGALANPLRWSGAAHLLGAILSTFSTTTQLLMGIAASRLASYERRREREAGRAVSVTVVPGPGVIHATLRF